MGMYRAARPATTVLRTGLDRLGTDDRLALRHLAAAALTAHGLLHATGVTLICDWSGSGDPRFASLSPARGSDPAVGVGSAWLLAGALFVTAGALLARGHHAWRAFAAVGVTVSVPALLPFSDDALYGLLIDWGVVLALTLTRSSGRSPR